MLFAANTSRDSEADEHESFNINERSKLIQYLCSYEIVTCANVSFQIN